MTNVPVPTRRIPGGEFTAGDDHHYPEESPSRRIAVAAFLIDVHAVTNAQFAAFVDATGHVTTAEREGGAVFVPSTGPVDLARPDLWWRHSRDANWRNPRGDGSGAIADHPVVQVARADADAYAAWVGGRLPTEVEWEWAANGGQGLPRRWPLADDGMLLANVWLGEFPWRSIRSEPPGTMPVGSFAPNVFGLFDMIGNAWEWTADTWFGDGSSGVAKGGSFLCAANYCSRYRPAARHPQPLDEPACHIGFRCAYDLGTGASDG